MAGEWREVPLWEIAEYINGRATKPSELSAQGVPVIKIAELNRGITEETDRIPPELVEDRHWIQEGDLLFAWSGSVGIYRYMGPQAALNQHIFKVIARPGFDQGFIRYLLLAQLPVFQMHVQDKKTTMGHVTVRDLQRIKVRIPPLPEQRAIAHILGTLDDKIELNRRMSETLEAMARALFKSWFVDFEPVRAKCRGGITPPLQNEWQWPGHILDLFPDRLVPSELGDIPEGWRMGRLGDVSEHPRRAVRPEEIKPGTPYIALEHMPRRSIALSEWGTATGLESNKFEFKKGEILFGKLRPYFHKVGVAPVDGVCSTDIVVVTPRRPLWFGFVLGHLSSVAFVEYTSAGSTGTKMPRTSWTDMARYNVTLPPDYIADAFTSLVQPLIERILANIHESSTLAALRDALLPKLISGELRVKDVEKLILQSVPNIKEED